MPMKWGRGKGRVASTAREEEKRRKEIWVRGWVGGLRDQEENLSRGQAEESSVGLSLWEGDDALLLVVVHLLLLIISIIILIFSRFSFIMERVL